MPFQPASSATPAAIARAALRRLAEQGIEPTPEQYRRAYLAATPPGGPRSLAASLLERLERLERLEQAPPALRDVAPRLRPALAEEDCERALGLLWDRLERHGAEADVEPMGPALAAFVREWERSQAGLSRVQKLQALQAIEGTAAAAEVLHRLRSTAERWAALRERPPAPPAAAAETAPPERAGQWKRLWTEAVRMAEQAYAAQPAIQAQAALLLEDAAALDDAGGGLAGRAHALWDACERWQAGSLAAQVSSLEAMRLLLDNVGQLFPPAHWLQERIEALRGLLVEPLDVQRVQQCVQELKDLLLRQGVAHKAGEDARALARELIDMVVRSLGSYVESTERYGDRLRGGMRELDESGDWQRAKSVVQGILAQSQQMLEETGKLRSSFAQAQQQLQQARERAHSLQGELEQLSELIQQDPLTGALNRRGLELSFRREAARASRSGEALSLAMVDLDFFKAINDRYGHDTGDAVLRELVQVLRAELRPTDLIARIGGKEFVVLLPGEDEQGAVAALQRAQRTFGARRFSHPRNPAGIEARFSVGVARWNGDEGLDSIYARIDRALLQAKAAGRDRIEVASVQQPGAG